jgi:hypothetical protein
MPDESHTRPDDSPAPSAPAAIGFAWLVRHIAVVGVAGLITGLVVAGGGSRLLMRVAAIAGHDDAAGRLTDSGFRVGETTLGGTLGFVLFIGLFAGGIGTILYLMSEPWLVWAGKWRGVVFGGFLLAVSSATSDALDPDNFDFELLGNKSFIVTMFVVLFLAYGGLLAWLSERLEDRARSPDPERPMPSVTGYLILTAVGAILFVPTTFLLFLSAESCGCDPPRAVPLFLFGMAVATVLLWVTRYTNRLSSWTRGIKFVGIGMFLGAAVTGAVRAIGDIATII